MRNKIIIGNWKMNNSLNECLFFIKKLLKLENLKNTKIKIGIAPSYPFLSILKNICKDNILIVAQNIHHKEYGAYTGEVSAKMIKSINIDMVILGHSERKKYFYENDDILLKKLFQALKYDIKIIFCIGETLLERNENNHFNVIKNQLKKTIFNLSSKEIKSIIIAYEPIWAIGTGNVPKYNQIQEMHHYIRSIFIEKYGTIIAANISIIYGGSLNSSNIKEILFEKDVDGGLIGNSSLKIEDFIKIINNFINL